METVGLFYARKDSLRNLCFLHDGRLDSLKDHLQNTNVAYTKVGGVHRGNGAETNFKIQWVQGLTHLEVTFHIDTILFVYMGVVVVKTAFFIQLVYSCGKVSLRSYFFKSEVGFLPHTTYKNYYGLKRHKCKIYNIQRKTYDLGLGGGFLRYDTKITSNNDKIDK